MKKLLVTLSALLSVTTAQAVQKKTLQAVVDIYDAVNESDLVTDSYFMAFTFESKRLRLLINETEGCKKESDFKKVSVKKLSTHIRNDVSLGIEYGYEGTDSYAELHLQLDEALRDLSGDLKDQDLKICHYSYTPAYSDGHEISIVKVDDKVKFAFEVGQPD